MNPDFIIDLFYYERVGARISVRSGAHGAMAYVGESQALAIGGSELEPWVARLAESIAANAPEHGDFRIVFEGSCWRGIKDHSNGSTQVMLRRLPTAMPGLDDLSIDPGLRTLLTHPWLNDGGLVLFGGLTGQGKTTVAGATVRTRLELFGGRAVAVEDVSELPMENNWGGGTCRQIEVNYDASREHDRGFAGAVRRAYRSMPASRPAILYIGEVRDVETAVEVVRAASNGMLVITTVHASDPVAGIVRLVSLAEHSMGATASIALAQALRLVVNQSIDLSPSVSGWNRAKYKSQVLLSNGGSSPAANLIRKGTFAQMQQVISQQNIRLQHHRSASGDVLLEQLNGSGS